MPELQTIVVKNVTYHLPYAYGIAALEFIKALRKVSSIEEAQILFKKMSCTYTLIPEITNLYHTWLLRTFDRDFVAEEIESTGFLHLCNEQWKLNSKSFQCLNRLVKTIFFPLEMGFPFIKVKAVLSQKYKNHIFLPLDRLVPMFWKYKMFSTSPMPSDKYFEPIKGSEDLSKLIISSENDEEKWSEYLRKAGDTKFIIQNFEVRIGRKPWNQKLWGLYLQYLEDSRLNAVFLHTYSRYCRLFIDDAAMFEKYKAAIDRCSKLSLNVEKWQTDVKSIKESFHSSRRVLKLWFDKFKRKTVTSTETEDDSPLTEYFNDGHIDSFNEGSPSVLYSTKNIQNQKLSLPLSIVHFIIEESRDYVLQKLYFSSKYFFNFRKTPICHKLDIAGNYDGFKYVDNSLFISSEAFKTTSNLPNFERTKILSMQEISTDLIPILLASLPTITELHLFMQKLTVKDFELLTAQVKFFTMNNASKVLDVDEVPLTVPKIVDIMPKLEDVIFNHGNDIFTEEYEYSEPKKALKTCIILIKTFEGYQEVDTSAFCNFIEKNCISSTCIRIDLHESGLHYFPKLEKGVCKSMVEALSKVTWQSRHLQLRMKLTLNRDEYYFS